MQKHIQILMIIFMVLFYFMTPLNAVIKNVDKPARGKWDFGLKKIWSVNSAGNNPLVNVQNIQADEQGNVFFMDRKYQKIAAFDPNGRQLVYFGKIGEGPGEIRRMIQLYLQGPNIIIEERGGRLHYFSKKGQYINTLRFNPRSEIKGFVENFKFISILSNFGTKAEKENENLVTYDIKEKKSTVITSLIPEEVIHASNGSGKDDFYIEVHIAELTPSVIFGTSGSSVFFGKNDHYIIKKMDFSGKELMSFSIEGRLAKSVLKKDKKKMLRKDLPPQILKSLLKSLPNQCTFFTKIHIDQKGLIYVYTSNIFNKKIQEIDIFSPSGQYLYKSTITFPGGLTPVLSPVFAGNHLIVFAEDEEAERKLIKYKINRVK